MSARIFANDSILAIIEYDEEEQRIVGDVITKLPSVRVRMSHKNDDNITSTRLILTRADLIELRDDINRLLKS